MIIVDKETFEAEVLQSSMPCVVDLWGPQCGPCLALMPEVEKLAEAYEGKLKFCKLNVAENRRLVISLRVMAVPTILFYKGGECVARISGDAVSIEAIKAEADAAKWDEQIGMMEMVLNVDALADAVRKMREANSKYPL